MRHINSDSKWTELTPGAMVYGSGNSKEFNTGQWRMAETPRWNEEKCKQCLLCFPVCPDCSIPVSDEKRGEFDLFHCKGCGICAKVCPFGAIEMVGKEEL